MHRLAVVPRALLNAMVYRGMAARLGAAPALCSLSGGESVRAFFLEQLVHEIDRAIVSARPSPRRPIGAVGGWASVGLNATFVWSVPLAGPRWPGHHYVFEVPPRTMTRAVRKALDAGIRTLEASLPSLSRRERDDILRRAAAFGR